MMHDFELHEFFHPPKNVLLKALLYKPQNQQVQKVMSQRSEGLWTRCTRSNAFPDFYTLSKF